MSKYFFLRVLSIFPILLFTSILIFLLIRLAPGGPLAAAERNPNVAPEQLSLLRQKYGLNEPLQIQYLKWIGQLFRGDFGESIKTHRSVGLIIVERLPNTLLLVGMSLIVTVMVAIPLGIYSAIKQYTFQDYIINAFISIGQSIPVYWLGLILIFVFYLWLRNPFTGGPLFPSSGMYTVNQHDNILDRIWHLILPVTMLSAGWIAWYTRFIRASMLEVIRSDYIRTARAKGVPEKHVLYNHALRNAALPIITIIALDLPAIFSGALFVETVFAWPGMGRLFWDSARARDYPVLLAIVLINSALIIISNLLADIVYGYLDPRINFENNSR